MAPWLMENSNASAPAEASGSVSARPGSFVPLSLPAASVMSWSIAVCRFTTCKVSRTAERNVHEKDRTEASPNRNLDPIDEHGCSLQPGLVYVRMVKFENNTCT